MTTVNAVNTYIVPTTSNEVTMPLQPFFQGSITTTQTNVTGDGTVYNANSVAYTENYDVGGNFDAATGVFTCPVAGIYLFSAAFSMGDLAAGHTTAELTIKSSGDDSLVLQANPGAIRTAGNVLTTRHTGILNLAASVTVYLQFTVTGGAKVVDVLQDSTVFQGILLL
jgi:hypothetical protein